MKKKQSEKLENLLRKLSPKTYDISRAENILNAFSDDRIKKMKYVMEAISIKATSEGITDSSDLMGKYIPLISNVIEVPYTHFPGEMKPFEINDFIRILDEELDVISLVKLLPTAVSVRFPVHGNNDFKNLKRLIDARPTGLTTTMEDNHTKKQNEDHEKVSVFPEKLRAGTQWKNITIVFIDERNVVVHAVGKKVPLDYEKMGFAKGVNAQIPTALWNFLETLAKHNGTITPDDPDAKPIFKKRKELLAKKLQAYFCIEADPFFPYESSPEKRCRSYTTRFGLFYEQKKRIDPFDDLQEFHREQSPELRK